MSALEDFEKVACLANCALRPDEFSIEFLPAPHKPPTALPRGRMAIYAFWGDGCWLKIGMAGSNSAARYTSQHYNTGSAPSTLAASLEKYAVESNLEAFEAGSAGDWIRANTHRVNVLIPSERPREFLALLEAFLHARLRPRHER